MFIGQAFLYNAVVFDLGTLLHEFFGVGSGSVPYYMAIFAVSNFLGPLLLGRFFDTVGRIPMISGTYLGSAAIVAALGVLLITTHMSTLAFMALVLGAFFLASAGASSAYLTVSEVFPMETRALAIAFFFAIGTATGGIVGPVLFGHLIHSGSLHLVAIGFFIGAGAMALGGIAELLFGVRAEQQSLENIAKPLTVEEAEQLLPLPSSPSGSRSPTPTGSATKPSGRASWPRTSVQGPPSAGPRCRLRKAGPPGRHATPSRPRWRRRSWAPRASTSWPPHTKQRARAAYAQSPAERRVALERAEAAEQRARIYSERAAALQAGSEAEAAVHAMLAEVAAERAREREQRALAEEARAEAQRLRGPAADLALARAEMHESWAGVHNVRAQALEAHANRDESQCSRARARGARSRADRAGRRAAGRRGRAPRQGSGSARGGCGALAGRARGTDSRAQAAFGRPRASRAQPCAARAGELVLLPGMIGTAGPASRLAAAAREHLDHEIEAITRALEERGPLEREELKRLVGGRYWGPRRFREALRAAIEEGRATPTSRTVVAPAPPPAIEPQRPAQDEPPLQAAGRSQRDDRT